MKAVTNPVKTEIEITSSQANVRFDVREQTTEVMGLKSNVKGPSAEWEWNLKEDKINKVQTIDENSTEVQYPSAKCVYEAIQNIPGTEQVQSDWDQTDDTQVDFIKHKPSLAAVATSGSYTDLTDKPVIPSAPVQSNWSESDSSSLAYIQNKPSLATVATSGSYNDLSSKPTIPVVATAITSGDNGYVTGDMAYRYIQSLDGTQIPY